jgi:hypothetical protein
MRKTQPIAGGPSGLGTTCAHALAILACGCALFACAGVLAQAAPESPDAAKTDEATAARPAAGTEGALTAQQRQVAERFRELEKLLLRMAELTAPSDPRRAALLRQAVAQSKQRDIDHQFEELVELLKQERFAVVVKNQGEVKQDLAALLELLLSEDRSKRIESEKERIREYLKRVNKIIKEQKAVQGETARGGEERKLADKQGELADKTGELAKDLKPDGGSKPQENGNDGEGQQGEPEKGDQDGEGKDPQEKESKDKPTDKPGDKPADKQGEKEKKPGNEKGDEKGDKDKGDSPQDGKAPEKSGQPEGGQKDGQPGQTPPQGEPQQGEGQSGGQPSEPQDNPAQKRVEQAQKRMKEAQQKLEEAKRSDAADKQAEALKELEQAKADLEEILRQLREEEMGRTLAMLESRFRKMLDAQVEVYEGTKRVDKVPSAERDRDDEIEAGRLSRKESQISNEADKALAVLREEGSAVAFPEAVTAMREDMEQVVARLAQAKVGEVTQGIEADIIAALEEMIASLQKAQKDMEEKSKQNQPPQNSEQDEPPLVDTLSELKMIRALQMRVNVRTQRYAKMTKTEQTDTPDLLDALKRLAEREQRIHKVTRDIVVGRNR